MRPVFHIFLHFIVPFFIAVIFYRASWKKAWVMMLAGLVIDVDHFLAVPIYAPGRCSLGFHPLHTWPAGLFYSMICIHPKTRLLGLGFIVHLILDGIDCIGILQETTHFPDQALIIY